MSTPARRVRVVTDRALSDMRVSEVVRGTPDFTVDVVSTRDVDMSVLVVSDGADAVVEALSGSLSGENGDGNGALGAANWEDGAQGWGSATADWEDT